MNNPFETIDARLTNIECLLLDLKHVQTPVTADIFSDQLLTIQQAGELLTLSVPTIYGLVSRKEIPVSKRGKRLYFSKQELNDWIRAGRKKTVAEIQAEVDDHLSNVKRRKG